MPAPAPAHGAVASIARAPGGSLRTLADQAFSRAAGAPLVGGNAVRLLRDAGENFPAWLAAIEGAKESISVEAYIFAEDRLGERFRDALAARARAGVTVRVLQDWLGSLGEASRSFWRPLRDAGGEVRAFNPPRLDSPLGWVGRNHRKTINVDGRIGFVAGLCIAARWEGEPAAGVAPWRDSGVELRGPAVADLSRAFASAWSHAGPPLPPGAFPPREALAPCGDVALRVIATEPATSGVFRLDQLLAALARRTLWITDAYFVGNAAYVQALRAAAADGVDVRVLVPGESDLVVVKRLSVAGFRPLLEAGVRIFEWKGSMLHAKTAVADGRWARVGSSNLNVSSWMANWEMDVAVDDEGFARRMEDCYEADLENATEVVLGARRVRTPRLGRIRPPGRRPREGSAVSAAGALRLGRAVGAAIGGSRVLGPAETRIIFLAAALLAGVVALAVFVPQAIAWPLAAVGVWFAIGLVARGRQIRREAREKARLEQEAAAAKGESA
ncbi:MAG: phospholipase D-like domain-containing protein [Anaeromyxobacter sp.]